MYQPRTYRDWGSGRRLVSYEVTLVETDLRLSTRRNLAAKARQSVRRQRGVIERHIAERPAFLTSLAPLPVPRDAPFLIRSMYRAARACGVGPMAAVAGAVAEYVGRSLLERSGQVIVENGGDIFFKTHEPPTFGLYAGKHSSFTGRVRFAPTDLTSGGVCTSSGTVGHSMSFGRADAVTVLAKNVALADAAATAIANTIRSAEDVQKAIDAEKERGVLDGGLIAIGDTLGAWGALEIVEGG